jgi:hypothetical protein
MNGIGGQHIVGHSMKFSEMPGGTQFKIDGTTYTKLQLKLPSGLDQVLLRMVDGQAFDFVNAVDDKGMPTRVADKEYEKLNT